MLIPIFLFVLAFVCSRLNALGEGLCPLACPEGWTRFGFSEHCYFLDSSVDTFDARDQRCKKLEPTSYIMVVDNVLEQALASAAVVQFRATSPNKWNNTFLWLGGRASKNGWQMSDGTNATTNVLMSISGAIKASVSGTCLSADPNSLGFWTARPCTDKGAAICEMPKRASCKRQAILPVTPILMTACNQFQTFNSLSSVPFIEKILGETILRDQLTGTGMPIKNNWFNGSFNMCDGGSGRPTGIRPCEPGCPKGWFSWSLSPNERCYSFQTSPLQSDTFGQLESKCNAAEKTAHISHINGFMELSMVIAMANSQMMQANNSEAHLWLGATTPGTSWQFLDGSDGGILVSLANLRDSLKNGTCLAADLKTIGNWRMVPCDSPNGVAICEMEKKPVCPSPEGTIIRVNPVDLTPEILKQLFLSVPSIPFLSQSLGNEKVDSFFDPWEAAKNQENGAMYGDSVTNITCVFAFVNPETMVSDLSWSGLPAETEKEVRSVTGQWVKLNCKSGPVDAFKVQAPTYLAVWSRCVNRGFDVAMVTRRPLETAPFLVGNILAEHYRQEKRVGAEVPKFQKIQQTALENC